MPYDWVDPRFKPTSLLDAATTPFRLLADSQHYSELKLRDPRLLLSLLCFPWLAFRSSRTHDTWRADAHARLVAACLDHDTRDRLDQVRVPCFVLHAGRDPITTVDHTGLLADLLPDCHTETWADTSHVIAGKEQKLRLDALLRSFYDGLAAVPAPEAAVAAHRASEV
jgi:pimeloyl-ACP methyl ester carboxylesterase